MVEYLYEIYVWELLIFLYFRYYVGWSKMAPTGLKFGHRLTLEQSIYIQRVWIARPHMGPTIISLWRRTRAVYTTKFSTSLWFVSVVIILASMNTTKCLFSDTCRWDFIHLTRYIIIPFSTQRNTICII